MLNKLIRNPETLRKLNSLTKYPSILTYHNLGKKGTLLDSLTESDYVPSDDEVLEGTEKVDGTNGRILIFNNDYIIGTREDLIYAKGDRIVNDTYDIVKNMKPLAEKLLANVLETNTLHVIYGESYGKNIGRNYKNYSSSDTSIRIFDRWDMQESEVNKILEKDLNAISTWREHGGQPFISTLELDTFCKKYNFERTPVVATLKASEFPTSLEGIWEILKKNIKTKVALEGEGESEGIVFRTSDRRWIKKMRVAEYRKTLEK